MLGGTIQYNEGSGNTGGVLVLANGFNMSGGIIQYNVGKNFGGVGIANAQPNFSGTAVVKGNVIANTTGGMITKTETGYTLAEGGTPCDVKHASGNGLNVQIIGELKSGARIGIFNNNQTNAFTTGYNTYNSSDVAFKFFFSNAAGKVVKKNDSGELVLAELNAENVTEMINALPDAADVTIADTDAIEAARAAYEALTDEQKAGVSAETLKKLTDAEAALVPATYDVTFADGLTDWTATPTSAAEGETITLNYTGKKKVKTITITKKETAPVTTTVTWDNTNVFVSGNSSVTVDKDNPYTYGGVEISFSGDSWLQLYNSGMNVTKLIVFEDDVCTFIAPSGKKFTKIEITDNSFATFTAYGDWTMDGDNKAIWSGTPSNTVTLGSSENSYFTNLKSIVFTMEDANN